MKIRHALGCALGAGAVGLSGTAFGEAEGLEYTYAQLDVISRDIDVYDDTADAVEDFDDGTGWAVRGSYAFTEKFFIFGEYMQTQSDVTFASEDVFLLPADEDTIQLSVGAGIATQIADNTDFVGRLAYTDVDYGDFDIGGVTGGIDFDELDQDEDDGFFVDAGVRSQLMENLQGSIGLRYLDIGGGLEATDVQRTSVIGDLMFEFNENWGINLAVDAGDELSTWSLGARWLGNER